MTDIRIEAARRMVWDKDASRKPGFVAWLTRLMKAILRDEELDKQDRAEVEMLLKKLYSIKL